MMLDELLQNEIRLYEEAVAAIKDAATWATPSEMKALVKRRDIRDRRVRELQKRILNEK